MDAGHQIEVGVGEVELQFAHPIEHGLVGVAVPVDFVFPNAGMAPVTEFIPIANSGLTQTLTITSVTPVGLDAAHFTVDSFPAMEGFPNEAFLVPNPRAILPGVARSALRRGAKVS